MTTSSIILGVYAFLTGVGLHLHYKPCLLVDDERGAAKAAKSSIEMSI
jgi:hypothetical protein